MRSFPFPDQVLSREEISRDIQKDKIPSEKIEEISDNAWNQGVRAAKDIMKAYKDKTIYEIMDQSGLVMERMQKERVTGNLRYFSEYDSKKSRITVYEGSIQKWALKNNCTYLEAEELILAHEYFHFLESTKLGELSKQYRVPALKIGRFVCIWSGIRALSEIGAHGFSRTYFDSKKAFGAENTAVLRNAAMNIEKSSELMRRTCKKSDGH